LTEPIIEEGLSVIQLKEEEEVVCWEEIQLSEIGIELEEQNRIQRNVYVYQWEHYQYLQCVYYTPQLA
jgi:hypothetical protein